MYSVWRAIYPLLLFAVLLQPPTSYYILAFLNNVCQGQSHGSPRGHKHQGQQNNQQQVISQEHPLQNCPLEDPEESWEQVTLQEGQPQSQDNVLPGDNVQGTDISNRNASGGSGRQTSQENPGDGMIYGAYRQSTSLQASQQVRQCNYFSTCDKLRSIKLWPFD